MGAIRRKLITLCLLVSMTMFSLKLYQNVSTKKSYYDAMEKTYFRSFRPSVYTFINASINDGVYFIADFISSSFAFRSSDFQSDADEDRSENGGNSPAKLRIFFNQPRQKFCSRDSAHCKTGKPCLYSHSVDLRIIPIVFNRAESLRKCLQSLYDLDTMGDRVVVNIWIDRSKNGSINMPTYKVASEFARTWKKGHACVHNQTSNAFINGQWVDTWRPHLKSNELAIIIEDDVTISPMTYRWLKYVHRQYGGWQNISGYTLQMENVNFFSGGRRAMSGPKNDTIFMYPVLGTWGFAPHPQSWRRFQDWHHEFYKNSSVKPYVPGIVPTRWYQMFEGQGTQAAMWEMWHIYYTYLNPQWCVYSNLVSYTGKKDVYLSTNRQEAGLHFGAGESQDSTSNLLRHWNDTYINFPRHPVMYSYNGTNLYAL